MKVLYILDNTYEEVSLLDELPHARWKSHKDFSQLGKSYVIREIIFVTLFKQPKPFLVGVVVNEGEKWLSERIRTRKSRRSSFDISQDREKELLDKEIGKCMSREFLQAGMRLKILRKWMYRRPEYRFRRWRSGSSDVRRARFSRIFDACGMRRRRNIIYILCKRVGSYTGNRHRSMLLWLSLVRNVCHEKETSV